MAFAILPTNIFLNTNNNNNDDDDQECIVRIFCWTWIRPHTPEDDYDDGDDVIIFSTNSVDWSSTRASGWHKNTTPSVSISFHGASQKTTS